MIVIHRQLDQEPHHAALSRAVHGHDQIVAVIAEHAAEAERRLEEIRQESARAAGHAG